MGAFIEGYAGSYSRSWEIRLSDNFNTRITVSSKDEWLTPRHLLAALGRFCLDPCAPLNRPWDTAEKHLTLLEDGLSQPWVGRVWLNPPYGRETFKWMKCLAEHPGGGIALIFARTDTKGFHREVFEKAHSIFFFEGRISFHHLSGESSGDRANAGSVLVSYNKDDSYLINEAIKLGNLTGKHVFL